MKLAESMITQFQRTALLAQQVRFNKYAVRSTDANEFLNNKEHSLCFELSSEQFLRDKRKLCHSTSFISFFGSIRRNLRLEQLYLLLAMEMTGVVKEDLNRNAMTIRKVRGERSGSKRRQAREKSKAVGEEEGTDWLMFALLNASCVCWIPTIKGDFLNFSMEVLN